ncbi:alpha/beta hydrolase [Patescibacteria group bacterium]
MDLRKWFINRFVLGPITEEPTINYECVEFRAQDGVLLRGWWLPAPASRKCIIIVHGGLKHRADPSIGTIQLAQDLVERGYNVFMFDLRGHGESEGEWGTVAIDEAQDVLAAFEYVISRGIDPKDISFLAFSMGAAATLLAATRDKRISAIVSDSCWAVFSDIMRFRWDTFPRCLMNLLLQVVLGQLPGSNPVEIVENIPVTTRMLFVHGKKDRTIPYVDAKRLRKASKNPAQLWGVDDAFHVGAYRFNSDEYVRRVIAFLEG